MLQRRKQTRPGTISEFRILTSFQFPRSHHQSQIRFRLRPMRTELSIYTPTTMTRRTIRHSSSWAILRFRLSRRGRPIRHLRAFRQLRRLQHRWAPSVFQRGGMMIRGDISSPILVQGVNRTFPPYFSIWGCLRHQKSPPPFVSLRGRRLGGVWTLDTLLIFLLYLCHRRRLIAPLHPCTRHPHLHCYHHCPKRTSVLLYIHPMHHPLQQKSLHT